MIRGTSYTIDLIFNAEYDVTRVKDIRLTIGNYDVCSLADGISNSGQHFLCSIPSDITAVLPVGERSVTLTMDDAMDGVRKAIIATIPIQNTGSQYENENVSETANMTLELTYMVNNISADLLITDVTALRAIAAAAAAKTSEDNAKISEDNAKQSETSAEQSESDTLGYKNTVQGLHDTVVEDAAQVALDRIATGEDAAQTALDRIATGEDAQTATTKAGEASDSAAVALQSKNYAAGYADTALQAKIDAEVAKSAAQLAKTNAETAETNAEAAEAQTLLYKDAAAAIVSGGPRGVYATLADLITANPDHTYTYVVTADGHWYYWNGSTFVEGGLYQNALGVAKSIGKNILNPSDVQFGKYINPSGEISNYGNTDVSPKIYFNGNPSITCNACGTGGSINYIGVYTIDDVLISVFTNTSTVRTINAADYADASYVLFTLSKSVTNRQIEYNTSATSFRAYSVAGGYLDPTMDNVETLQEDVLNKADNAIGSNILDATLITWGKWINYLGVQGDIGAGIGVTPKLYFMGHGTIISQAIARAHNAGAYLNYYKQDGTLISSLLCPENGIVPIVTDASYIIATIDGTYESYELKAEYSDVITTGTAEPSRQLGKYLDKNPLALYAYADGDETPDVDNKFYGNKGYWKAWHNVGAGATFYTLEETPVAGTAMSYVGSLNHGQKYNIVSYYDETNGISFDDITYYVRDETKDLNVGSIQRAINSCEDGRKYTIYCKGHFLFDTIAQFAGNRGVMYAMVWMRNPNITLQGYGINETIIEVALPGNLGGAFPYYDYSPVEYVDGTINDMSIIGHNCRYAIHSVGAKIVDMNRVRMWHKTNTDDAFVAWPSQCTLGIGSGVASKYNLYDCDLIDEGYPIYIHNNNGDEFGYHYLVKDTRLVCKNSTTGQMGTIATLFNLNAPSHGVLELKNVALGNRRKIIVGEDSSYSKTIVFPEIYTRIIGDVNVPIYYLFSGTIGKVLKITSATTGTASIVRIDSASTAFSVIMQGATITDFELPNGLVYKDHYRYFDGADGLAGWACGELALDTGTSGSMQTRLGNCTSSPKSLIMTIDGVEKTVTFDQDYTGYSDANMLAVINNAISGAGTAELYTLGKEYYPELNQIIENLPNNSDGTILRGMGVNILDGEITASTTDTEVKGIALDDIKIGYIGRIMKKGYLPTTESRFKVKLGTQAACTVGDKYKIGSIPGVFEKDNANGVFIAEYASLVKFDL